MPWLVLTGVLNIIGGLISMELVTVFSTIIGLVIEGYLFVCVWSFRSEGERLRDFYNFRYFCFRQQLQQGEVVHRA